MCLLFSLTKDMLTASGITMEKKESELIILHSAAWKLSCPIHQAKGITTVSAYTWRVHNAWEPSSLGNQRISCPHHGQKLVFQLMPVVTVKLVCCDSFGDLSYYRTRSSKRFIQGSSMCFTELLNCFSSFCRFSVFPPTVSQDKTVKFLNVFAWKLSNSHESFEYF